MPNISLEFPIYKDNYVIIDEILARHNYGNVYRVISNNNVKYTLHMIKLDAIKELKLENNLKNIIKNHNKHIHWAYIDNEIFDKKVPIDNTHINKDQRILRAAYYYIITDYNINNILSKQ
jgi:hypothetical protein